MKNKECEHQLMVSLCVESDICASIVVNVNVPQVIIKIIE